LNKLKLNRLNQLNYLKKWQLMLLQGILLVLLGLAFFIQPENPLPGFQHMVSIVSLINGGIFIFGYFFANPFDKSQTELILGAFLFTASLVFLFASPMGQSVVSFFLSAYMLLNAFYYAFVCWDFQSEMKFWWVSILLIAYTLFIVILIQTSISEKTLTVHALTGLHFLWCGLIVILLAFDNRKLVKDFNKPIGHLR